jgi:LytR cell envelope-related transcriptional attenuator
VERGPLTLGARSTRLMAGLSGGLLVAGLVLVGARYVHRQAARAPVEHPTPRFEGRDVRSPNGVRITVEVLNASRTRGLGRRATLYLRDRGFDVVAWGNAPELRDTTLVIDRSAHAEWARLVAQALGGARVESHPDSSRYVDVSVVLGATWRPPAQPFYP